MRNNTDRLGQPAQASEPPVGPVDQAGPEPTAAPLSFSTPTEFVDLPSKGKLYPEGHPLHNKEYIEIRYMTAKDEDILASRNLLKKGVAVDRLLQNVIVDKNLKIEDMLVGDKNALVVATRITGYGANYSTSVSCPSCTANGKHEFDLEDSKITGGYLELEEEDETFIMTDNATFIVELPKMKAKVEIKLLTGSDENQYVAFSKKRKNHGLQGDSILTDQLRMFIVSVNGSNSKKTIGELIEHMPASDSRFLRQAYSSLMPNIDLTQDFTCDSCGYSQQMEVPLTADFFWPGR
tara:strand:- start:834 stop:1712 length:879 start_codon:yes stop_codon:yes gene_type:complete